MSEERRFVKEGRQGEGRAVLDDYLANGSRLRPRFARLAGMTSWFGRMINRRGRTVKCGRSRTGLARSRWKESAGLQILNRETGKRNNGLADLHGEVGLEFVHNRHLAAQSITDLVTSGLSATKLRCALGAAKRREASGTRSSVASAE